MKDILPLLYPLSGLRESCYATLVYFDLFDYPLTFDELQLFFLGELPLPNVLADFLEKEEGIETEDNYYFLKGRQQLLKTRKERQKIAENYWKKVKFYLPFLQMVPFIKMVSVCNTLAFDNASEESDIDLFIVAEKGRLFIVRFLTVFLLNLLGVRRHGHKISGRFCLSFYVTEDNLNLQPIMKENDIYLLYWILTLQPVYGQKCYVQFIRENHWISHYFQRNPFVNLKPKAAHSINKNLFFDGIGWVAKFFLKGKMGNQIEKKLQAIQFKRHAHNLKNLTTEASVIVSEKILKFHNIDRRKEISQKFHEHLKARLAS